MLRDEKRGYHFAGWYIDQERTKRINPGARLSSSMELFPKWELIRYPVVYELEEGAVNSKYNPEFVSIESSITKLFPAEKPGMQFDGWYENGIRVEYLPERLDRKVHLKGRFKPCSTITFETGEGSSIRAARVSELGQLPKTPVPVRLGYVFHGWFLDPDCSVQVTPQTRFYRDTTVYAGWKLKRYLVFYETFGGVIPPKSPVSYTTNTPSFILPACHRQGYRFKGWLDSRGNPILIVRSGQIADLHLQAQWEKDEPEVYRISSKG